MVFIFQISQMKIWNIRSSTQIFTSYFFMFLQPRIHGQIKIREFGAYKLLR